MSMPARLTTALAAAVLALVAPAGARAALSVVPSPNAPVGTNTLSGVRASSTTDAWAVGYSCCRPNNFGQATLTEHWDGQAWSIVASPDTRLNDDVLNAVVDLSPANAWAVGEIKQSGYRSGSPLILHWNGSGWQSVAPPSGTTGKLLAITATAANDVWAVGDDNHGQALVLHWNGASWARQAVPQLTGSGHLRGVRAYSGSNVWAVGDESSSTLVLHWNGTAWSRMPTPNPDPFVNILHAIAGPQPNDFWVVGQNARSKTSTGVPPGTRTFAMHWTGSGWSMPTTPNQGDEDSLRGVSGSGSVNRIAVGTFQNPTTGSLRTLAERFDGSSWTVQPTPNVGTADNWLRADAPIPGTTEIWAVGSHLTSGGPAQTLILRGT